MSIRSLVGTMAWLAVLALAACNGGEPRPAGGASGSSAKEKNQQGGSSATGARNQASNQGGERDGLVCDDASYGVGWCENDSEIVFCAEGSWWLLDCSLVEEGAYCAYDEASNEVDCFIE